MSDKIYIVTGAAGHLGSYIVKQLLEQGEQVRALVLPGEACPGFIDENRNLLAVYTGNVCQPESLAQLFEGGTTGDLIVIHCAAIITLAKKENRRVFDVNVGGTANIVEACRKYSAQRLVYVSSVHAIPPLPRGQIMREVESFDPAAVPGYYDKTKAMATQLVLDAARGGLDAVVVHPSGIIGPHGLPTGNMAQLFMRYVRGKLRAATRGGFDFVDVRDVARGVIAAAADGVRGECYILSNRYVDLTEMFDTLSEASSRKKLRLYLPSWIVKAFAPFAEAYYRLARKTPLFTRYSLETLSGNAAYSHEKASMALGYSTRSLKETLADTVKWLKE
ncbi:MAG: NAD-dependent epimerase/dehydratase family protein [Oscillospiraceae bacterium]|nr:NAD-dependent epimerase/dehydratase family protein [Oscillospiraceae bacterium]